MAKAPTPARAEKMKTALDLRKQGKTYREIAEAVGYGNAGDAHRLVSQALHEVTRESADDVLSLELERLDQLLTSMMPSAMRGNEKAVLRVLNIMDRRARYLGLDKVTPPDVSQESRDALTGLMAALTAAATPLPGDPS